MLTWQRILGCVETVVGPLTTSHVECSAEERMAAGIPEGWLGIQLELKMLKTLIEDLESSIYIYFIERRIHEKGEKKI